MNRHREGSTQKMVREICYCIDSGCPVAKVCSRFIKPTETDPYTWVGILRKPEEPYCERYQPKTLEEYLNRTREFCTFMLAAAAIAFAMHTTERTKAYPTIPVGIRDTCELANWHPDC